MDYDYPPRFGGSLNDAWKEIHRLKCKNRRSLREAERFKEYLGGSVVLGVAGWAAALLIFLWRVLP